MTSHHLSKIVNAAIGGLALSLLAAPLLAAGVVYEGKAGPGQGKHIVLVAGDEEYRSEEALPQLGKILATRHGFKCTVLFPIGDDGTINPNASNIPGLEALESADLLVIFTRFRDLPDEQMQHLVDYIESGRPIIGIRTATHAFNTKSAKFGKYTWTSKEPGYEQGFGRQVLGETWISHHGRHGSQSTRGIIAPGQAEHPILRGIKDGDIWGPTDVYGVRLPLPGDSQPLVLGQVLEGMKPDDKPVEGKVNDPMMPIAWTKTYKGAAGKPARVFTSTIGAANDLPSAGTRRLLVNACYWAMGLEDAIKADANVELVGAYEPSNFKFNGFKTGVRPADHELK
jgi:type 1 glutamine amidotransferase